MYTFGGSCAMFAFVIGHRDATLISGAAFVLSALWPIYRHQRIKKEGLKPHWGTSLLGFFMLPFFLLWFGLINLLVFEWRLVDVNDNGPISLILFLLSGAVSLFICVLAFRLVAIVLRKKGLLPEEPQAPEPTPDQTATRPTTSLSYTPRSYSGYSGYSLTDDAFARRQRQREIVAAAIAILGLIPPEELAKWSGMGGSSSEGSGGEDSSGDWDSFRYF
jgi:heme/copper-type cytochrome/quinol oxidase subunit 1